MEIEAQEVSNDSLYFAQDLLAGKEVAAIPVAGFESEGYFQI